MSTVRDAGFLELSSMGLAHHAEDDHHTLTPSDMKQRKRKCWKKRPFLILIVILIVAAIVAGIVLFFAPGSESRKDGNSPSAAAQTSGGGNAMVARVPVWQIGASWGYTHFTYDSSGTRHSTFVEAVNSRVLDTSHQYILAAVDLEDAVEHAVANAFPYFGRVTTEDLRVYENGAPQPLFGYFPISANSPPWEFKLLGKTWKGTVQNITSREVTYVATSTSDADGVATLQYNLDLISGFLQHMEFINNGKKQQELILNSHRASGFEGTTYFVRASDLYDGSWPSNDTAAPSFTVGQHRTDGAWDMLVYTADVAVGCTNASVARIMLTGLTTQETALDRKFLKCQEEHLTVGTINKPLDTAYDVSVTVGGDKTAVSLSVAGGKLYTYKLPV